MAVGFKGVLPLPVAPITSLGEPKSGIGAYRVTMSSHFLSGLILKAIYCCYQYSINALSRWLICQLVPKNSSLSAVVKCLPLFVPAWCLNPDKGHLQSHFALMSLNSCRMGIFEPFSVIIFARRDDKNPWKITVNSISQRFICVIWAYLWFSIRSYFAINGLILSALAK